MIERCGCPESAHYRVYLVARMMIARAMIDHFTADGLKMLLDAVEKPEDSREGATA